MDEQYIWWHSSTALPVGQLALNFGRIKDPVIDEALDANRGETDPAKRKELAETVNRALRRAVLQPLGRLDHLGRAPRARGAHRPTRHASGRHRVAPHERDRQRADDWIEQ